MARLLAKENQISDQSELKRPNDVLKRRQLGYKLEDRGNQEQNLALVEQEEMKDRGNDLRKLTQNRQGQERLLKKKLQEHRMCIIEIIRNLDELENLTDKKVDLSIVQGIIRDAPIYVPKLPLTGIQENIGRLS